MTHAASALLLACAGPRSDAATAHRVREHAARVERWEELVTVAERHRVLASLARELNAHAADLVPAETLAFLRRACTLQAAANLRLARALHEIVSAFDAADIRLLAHKGPSLAVLAHGDLALRSFDDLDVLVHPGDVARAGAALVSLGYAPGTLLTDGRRAALVRWDLHEHYVRGDTDVELHWRLVKTAFGGRFDFDGLWARSATVRLGGAEVRTLGPEDLLVALCVHGATHAWSRLAWVSDVAALVDRSPALDWARVRALADALGKRRMVRAALGLALAIGARVDESTEAWIRAEPGLDALGAMVLDVMFDEDAKPGVFVRYQFAVRERGWERLALAGRTLFTPGPEDWDAVELPDSLAPLYRVVRPARLLAKYAGGLVRGR